jgi:hypothetical protein
MPEKFLNLMAQRKIETIDRSRLDEGCLLCSEDKPHHCHRRLVAEYLKDKWGGGLARFATPIGGTTHIFLSTAA